MTVPPAPAAAGGGPQPPARSRGEAAGRAALLVAAGILTSRVVGLIRQRVFAYYFGVTEAADAFNQAFRIPNLLQNLFGEGVLSASFIPVYAHLRARGDDASRREVAHAVASLLTLLSAVIVAAGVLAAPLLTRVIAPGFTGAKYELTVTLVRILFPGAALFVLSAWSLGVLNSHGRFFLSYVSAVFWNAAMIATMLIGGGTRGLPELAVWLAWGSVVGALLQLSSQLPWVWRLVGPVRPHLARVSANTRQVLANFVPVFVGRGVTQISAFVDAVIASQLVNGSVATLSYAQLLYMLPVSLFGISVTAAELPAMAGTIGDDEEVRRVLRERLAGALGRIAYFVIPSAVAFAALGDVLASLLYQNGRFGTSEARWVWGTLVGGAVGLLASTLGRLYASVFYALRDPRTPLRYALLRVSLTVALGLLFALWLPGVLGVDPRWAVAGLPASAGVAGWVEFVLLRRAVARRIGGPERRPRAVATLWACALLAAALAWAFRLTTPPMPVFVHGLFAVTIYGATYLVATWAVGLREARALVTRLRRR
jgi:putative peptidoglycan lipid II flippase